MTTPALQALAQDVNKFTANYKGKPVEVLPETVNTEKHTVAIKGDFGSEWTHGGYAPKTKMIVAVKDLTNKLAYLSNGEVIQAKG